MQRHKIKIALALFLVASLMVGSVAAVASQDSNVKDLKWGDKKRPEIDTVYHTILVTGMTGDSVTFNIMGSAVKDKTGNVTIMDHKTPITVQYYFSNDTAVVSKPAMGMKNRTGWQRPTKVSYNDATLKVAGASAVIAAKNITMKRIDNNTSEAQFSAFSVYLPDGTAKSYKLDTPVKAVTSRVDRSVKVTGNAQFRADMQDALKGGAKFPANAAPVALKTIDAKM